MRRNFILYILSLTTLFSATSCDRWLELQPQDGIIKEEFWKTKEQVQSAVIGCYASLLGNTTSGRTLVEQLFLWGELRADMLSPTLSTLAEEQDLINVNILPSNTIANWRVMYKTINYCNTVIDFAPEVLNTDKTFSQQALNGYVAEAKSIRALMYFYLVRTFGEVPLKLTATSSDEEITPLAKSTKAEILEQIVKDLSEAESNALLTYGSNAADKGRITRYGVNAIQADVYLWMEKYAESLAACDKIIKSNRFGLIEGNSAWFNQLFVVGNSNESIFEFQFDRQKLNPFYTMFSTVRRRFIAHPMVMEEVYTQDFNDDTKKDVRGDGASLQATDGTIWKYLGLSATVARPVEESYAHWIVYRYADVLLIKAEAVAMLNRGQEALGIVKLVRDRAKALDGTNLSPDPTDTDGVMEFILKERAREFAFEGKRWYDVLRHAKRNNYKRLDLLLNMVANTVPADRQQSAIAKSKDFNSHYLPIFEYEIQTNRKLIQNPFYK